MGKGDKKTKRGKIILGSSGVKRPKNKKKSLPSDAVVKKVKEEKVEVKAEKKATEAKPAKKTTKKEPTAE